MHRAAILALLFGACSTMFGSDETSEEHTAGFYVQNAQRMYDGGHYNQALQQFEKALAEDDDDKTALLGRAWCMLFLAEGSVLRRAEDADDRLAEADTAFEALREVDFDENQYKVQLGQGKIRVLYGDLYAARAGLLRRRAATLPPTAAEDSALADTLKSRDAEYRKALKIFQAVLDMKDTPGAEDNLVALIHLARINVILRQYNNALIFAERYLKQVEYSKGLWVQSSINYPENKALWEAKLAGAVTKEVEVRDLIGDILYKLGRYDLAERELTEVIFLSPERGDAYLNRAIVREHMMKRDEALEDYRSFMFRAARLDLDPQDPRVIKATERILVLEKELGLPSSLTPKKTAAK
jgi:tetratricopeptide (TPR) repeat protein